MAKTTKWGGATNEYAQRRAHPPTMADVLRARGKLGPYEEEVEVLNECGVCTTSYAASLDACPQCGTGVAVTLPEEVFLDTAEVYPAQVSPYEGWLLADLQEECARRLLAKSGNKPDLVQRLLDNDADPTEKELGL